MMAGIAPGTSSGKNERQDPRFLVAVGQSIRPFPENVFRFLPLGPPKNHYAGWVDFLRTGHQYGARRRAAGNRAVARRQGRILKIGEGGFGQRWCGITRVNLQACLAVPSLSAENASSGRRFRYLREVIVSDLGIGYRCLPSTRVCSISPIVLSTISPRRVISLYDSFIMPVSLSSSGNSLRRGERKLRLSSPSLMRCSL